MSSSECPACTASRRSAVDAFFLGYRLGYVATVQAGYTEYENPTPQALELPEFCLAHDKMLTETYVGVLKEIAEKGRKDNG